MQTVIGIILLITYVGFIVYAAKGGNLCLGLFAMAVIWSALGFIAGVIDWPTINSTIFTGGPQGFGTTAVNIIFGSWFGRVLVETGIARTIIRKAVELGGDKPALTTCLLCIVVTAIFTTAYGVGAVIAIAVIVFPILLSIGVSKPLATGAFCMSVSCGLYFNSSLLQQAAGTMVMPDESTYTIGSDWYRFAAVALGIHLVLIFVMVIFNTRKEAKKQNWAADAVDLDEGLKNVNLLACLTPLIPVTLSVAFGVEAITAIFISVFWAFVWTGSIKSWKGLGDLITKTLSDGVSDVGPVLAFLLIMQTFVKSAGQCKSLLAPIISPIIPQNTMFLFIVFGALGFLALFRGPLTIWGAGTATFAIIASAGTLPIETLYPLFYILCLTINTNICPTQSWNTWAIGYNKITTKDFMKLTLPYGLLCTFILEVVAYFMLVA